MIPAEIMFLSSLTQKTRIADEHGYRNTLYKKMKKSD